MASGGGGMGFLVPKQHGVCVCNTDTVIIRLSSNLRQTTCKCTNLVRHGHFRSRDKDGGHNIRGR